MSMWMRESEDNFHSINYSPYPLSHTPFPTPPSPHPLPLTHIHASHSTTRYPHLAAVDGRRKGISSLCSLVSRNPGMIVAPSPQPSPPLKATHISLKYPTNS